MTVFPTSRSRSSVAISLELSRWCRPIEGSSRTYSTPTSAEPICVARRMRCASPPDSVAAARSIDRYPMPTFSRNRSRSSISRTISRAMWRSVSLSCTPSSQLIARRTLIAENSWMAMPPTSTARDSGRSRAPLHAGHGTIDMNSSIFSRDRSESVSR
jgi:hypothetical protein